uniref:Uncharacterized protein n=1 Tax=Romanomermis culicivorax TaxID=13658 RepID=A0A915KTD0_ROMCU
MSGQFHNLLQTRVLPDDDLILRIAMRADQFAGMFRPGDITNLRSGVDTMHRLTGSLDTLLAGGRNCSDSSPFYRKRLPLPLEALVFEPLTPLLGNMPTLLSDVELALFTLDDISGRANWWKSGDWF